ncbi:MAG: hypothetical protein JST80_10460 [Bdellovibrionales bacterium]|nr:hypothetical protein [Bdellovibrionales bacterium]
MLEMMGHASLKVALVLSVAFSYASAVAQDGGPGLTKKFSPDKNQKVYIFSDFDRTIGNDLGNYIIDLLPNPGFEGLGNYSGLVSSAEVTQWEYEGATNRNRIRDLLGSVFRGQPAPFGAFEPIKLESGATIIPALYQLDPIRGMTQFRPPVSGKPEDGFLYQAIVKNFEKQIPFLMDAAPYIALSFSDRFPKGRVKPLIVTMAGRSGSEVALSMNYVAQQLKWGPNQFQAQSAINLSNPNEAYQWAKSKSRVLTEVYKQLSNTHMQDHSVPHYLIVLENDTKQIEDLTKTMRNLAHSGVGANPVVPILVNLDEPELMNMYGQQSYLASSLETAEVKHRVTIFGDLNKIEYSENLARPLELAFGLDSKEALQLFKSYDSPIRCSVGYSNQAKINKRGGSK